MVYDGIITKPDLTEENMLAHWGIKGMKWRRGKKGVTRNSNGSSFLDRFKAALNANRYDDVGNAPLSSKKKTVNKKKSSGNGVPKTGSTVHKILNYQSSHDSEGNPVSRSSSSSSNRPRSRKKNVVSGSASVKRRGKA